MRIHPQVRRWAEVALASLVLALTVWDSFPVGTPVGHVVRAALAAALGPVLIYLRHGRGARIPAPASPPRGFVRIEVLTLVAAAIAGAMLASLAGCAFHSKSAGEMSNSSSAEITDHVEDHGSERTAEHVVTKRSGGAVDVREYFPDGKLKREMHRAPVDQVQDAQKHADVQKALSDDANALLGGEMSSKTSNESDSHPAMSCAFAGGMGGVAFLLLVGLVVWRLAKRARAAAAAAKAVADVVSPLP